MHLTFESNLVPEDNGNQNPDESHTNIERVVSGYAYKLVCVNDKFSKYFNEYLREDTVYNFIDSMIEESKYCSDVIKNILRKNLGWLKKTIKILRTLLNVGSARMIMLIKMLK